METGLKRLLKTEMIFFISVCTDTTTAVSTGKHTSGGNGAGKGFNLNIPFNNLSDGLSYMGDDENLMTFQNKVLPVVNEFRPDLIIVSCGFDS